MVKKIEVENPSTQPSIDVVIMTYQEGYPECSLRDHCKQKDSCVHNAGRDHEIFLPHADIVRNQNTGCAGVRCIFHSGILPEIEDQKDNEPVVVVISAWLSGERVCSLRDKCRRRFDCPHGTNPRQISRYVYSSESVSERNRINNTFSLPCTFFWD